jgi:alpha-galactosidase
VIKDERGAQRLAISLTNTSGGELNLTSWTVEFPWVALAGPNDRLSTGGWDMGRSEARVWSPAAAEKVTTGSYVLAKNAEGFSLAAFTSWRTFNAKLRFAGGSVVVTGDGEGRLMRAGETVALETIWLTSGTDWQDLLFAYADEIARENHIRLNAPKPYIGWATWDYFGRNWTYDQVVANLDKLLEIYPKADFLQIDGGWWPQRGDYTLVRANLQPEGMKRLGALIRQKKLTAGIHLDGMRGDAKSQVAKDHPEFFLRDDKGRMLVDSAVKVGDNLDYTFFDFSNPATAAYFTEVMANIRGNWGYDYFKVDFLRFGLNDFIHSVVGQNVVITPHNRGLTSVERFHLGLTAMRRGMGPDAFFVGCSAVFGPTFGHVDGLRSGADINPEFRQFKKCAVDNSGNFYLHGKVVHTDADYHVVRAKEDQDETLVKAANKDGKGMTLNEAEMWTHFVALCGGPRLNSDNLPTLREERRALFRFAADFPTAERYVPLDFWAHARDDEDVSSCILTQAKGDVYLGVFNWTETEKKWSVTGLTADDLKAFSKVSGAAVTETAEGKVTITLPARHSTLFKLAGGKFDRLRKAIQIN